VRKPGSSSWTEAPAVLGAAGPGVRVQGEPREPRLAPHTRRGWRRPRRSPGPAGSCSSRPRRPPSRDPRAVPARAVSARTGAAPPPAGGAAPAPRAPWARRSRTMSRSRGSSTAGTARRGRRVPPRASWSAGRPSRGRSRSPGGFPAPPRAARARAAPRAGRRAPRGPWRGMLRGAPPAPLESAPRPARSSRSRGRLLGVHRGAQACCRMRSRPARSRPHSWGERREPRASFRSMALRAVAGGGLPRRLGGHLLLELARRLLPSCAFSRMILARSNAARDLRRVGGLRRALRLAASSSSADRASRASSSAAVGVREAKRSARTSSESGRRPVARNRPPAPPALPASTKYGSPHSQLATSVHPHQVAVLRPSGPPTAPGSRAGRARRRPGPRAGPPPTAVHVDALAPSAAASRGSAQELARALGRRRVSASMCGSFPHGASLLEHAVARARANSRAKVTTSDRSLTRCTFQPSCSQGGPRRPGWERTLICRTAVAPPRPAGGLPRDVPARLHSA
jgi:hypothetical protein